MAIKVQPETDSGEIDGLLAFARSHGFLGRLPKEVVDKLVESAPVVRCPMNGVEFPLEASIVLSGVLRYFLSAADGRQITIRYVGAGELLGSVAAPNDALSTGAEAIEPTVLLLLDAARMQAVASRHPELGLRLVEEMTVRLRRAYQVLASRSFASVKVRIARDLIERARALSASQSAAQLRVTQQALADATGSVREVVARSLAEMRRQGIIATYPSHVTILDADALAKEARLGGSLGAA